MLILVFLIGPVISGNDGGRCSACKVELVEDIPLELKTNFYPSTRFKTSFEVFNEFLINTKQELLILTASSALRGEDANHEYRALFGRRGEHLFNLLNLKGKQRGLEIRLIDSEKKVQPWKYSDAKELQMNGTIQRRSIDKSGNFMQHAKLYASDRKHIFIGSSNFDHKSLNLKSEMGIVVKDCPCFAEDATEVFESLWDITKKYAIAATYNSTYPMVIGSTQLYIAMSPPSLRQSFRDSDLDAMIRAAKDAKKFVNISVMDVWPESEFGNDGSNIDDFWKALYSAVDRGVEVNLLTTARFARKRVNPIKFIRKLHNNGINVKIIKFPQNNVLGSRKLHSKYLITDEDGIISTSNFTPDYFYHDTGLAVVIKEGKRNVLAQMEGVFNRYWNSEYTKDLSAFLKNCKRPECQI